MTRSAAVASDLLTGFPAALREAGLPVDPGRTLAFLRATATCRLHDIHDLARLGRVTLTGSPDDFPVFDAVFEQFFGEATFAGKVDDPEDDRIPRSAPPRSEQAMLQIVDGEAAGHAASDEHLRNRKTFNRLAGEDRDTLARLSRRLGDMPKALSRKWVSSSRGARINLAALAALIGRHIRHAEATEEALHLRIRSGGIALHAHHLRAGVELDPDRNDRGLHFLDDVGKAHRTLDALGVSDGAQSGAGCLGNEIRATEHGHT